MLVLRLTNREFRIRGSSNGQHFDAEMKAFASEGMVRIHQDLIVAHFGDHERDRPVRRISYYLHTFCDDHILRKIGPGDSEDRFRIEFSIGVRRLYHDGVFEALLGSLELSLEPGDDVIETMQVCKRSAILVRIEDDALVVAQSVIQADHGSAGGFHPGRPFCLR